MNSFDSNRKFSYKELLYKCLIFIITVGVIAYFMPKEGKFNYEFDMNKPWKYGLLQASFDFPIYKNEQQVQREQDSLLNMYQPYFHMNKQVEKEMLSLLREDYEKNLKHSLPSQSYIRHIERTLKDIYNMGIISSEDDQRLQEDSIRSILLVEKNMATSQGTSNLFSIKEAYEHLLNVDTLFYSKKLLQACNLNHYLTPNLTYDKEKSETAKKELLSSISWANGLVLNGQKIIDRGEIVNEQRFNILQSLQRNGRNVANPPKKFI